MTKRNQCRDKATIVTSWIDLQSLQVDCVHFNLFGQSVVAILGIQLSSSILTFLTDSFTIPFHCLVPHNMFLICARVEMAMFSLFCSLMLSELGSGCHQVNSKFLERTNKSMNLS